MREENERKRQLAVETLLDSEGLTDDLRDKAAKQLLNWGISQTERLITEAETNDDRAINRLRRLIRRVNNLVAGQNRLADDEFAAELDDLKSFAAEELGLSTRGDVAAQPLLAERETLDESELVSRLTALLAPGETKKGIPSDRAENIDGPSAAWAVTCHAEGDEEPSL